MVVCNRQRVHQEVDQERVLDVPRHRREALQRRSRDERRGARGHLEQLLSGGVLLHESSSKHQPPVRWHGRGRRRAPLRGVPNVEAVQRRARGAEEDDVRGPQALEVEHLLPDVPRGGGCHAAAAPRASCRTTQ